MARVLAISSQVARGAIGLSAIVPALQALGHEVIALPTVLLSNHPGHARFAGDRVSADLISRMVDALDANGWLGEVDAVLTGYLPSVDHVEIAAAAVARVRARQTSREGPLYLCDPVIGDWPKGVYIADAAAEAIRDRLVPLADVLTPNAFELGWLAGCEVGDLDAVRSLAGTLQTGTVTTTSVPIADDERLANVCLVRGEGRHGAEPDVFWTSVRRRARVANGTGDLFAALLLGHMLRRPDMREALGRATAGVEHIVARSEGLEELSLAPNLDSLASVEASPVDSGSSAPSFQQ